MLIIAAHKFLEKFTLSKWQQYWKDQVANWYGMFLHESQYLEPVMRDIEAMLESSQRNVNGCVTMLLAPRRFETVGVDSKDDLVKNKLGEYGEMQKGWTAVRGCRRRHISSRSAKRAAKRLRSNSKRACWSESTAEGTMTEWKPYRPSKA